MSKRNRDNREKTKRKQRRAAKEAGRKEMNRIGKEQVRVWLRKRSSVIGKGNTRDNSDDSIGVGLDENIVIPQCGGVGDCCRNRPLFLEPSDVLRIISNKNVQEKFGVLLTTDLYVERNGSPPLLIYDFNVASDIPMCFVNWKSDPDMPENEDKVCPFFIKTGGMPSCILGDDRLTQCCSDPLIRVARINDKRRMDGWKFKLSDTPCVTCRCKTSMENVRYSTRDWIQACGMLPRYDESDLFLSFVNWMKGSNLSSLAKINATAMLFNWHRLSMELFGHSREEALEQGPKTIDVVLRAAKVVTEHIMKVRQFNDGPQEEEGRSNPCAVGSIKAEGET